MDPWCKTKVVRDRWEKKAFYQPIGVNKLTWKGVPGVSAMPSCGSTNTKSMHQRTVTLATLWTQVAPDDEHLVGAE
jgi:hypothetical protein